MALNELPGIIYKKASLNDNYHVAGAESVINVDTKDADFKIYLQSVRENHDHIYAINKTHENNKLFVIPLQGTFYGGPDPNRTAFLPVLTGKGDFVMIKSDSKRNWAVVSSYLTNTVRENLSFDGWPVSGQQPGDQLRINPAGTAFEFFSPAVLNASGLVRVNMITATTVNFNANLDLHGMVVIDATLNNVEVKLPTAVGNQGKGAYFCRSDSSGNLATVRAFGTQTIDGQNVISLYQYDNVILVSNGANWKVL